MASSLISSVIGILQGVGSDWADLSIGAVTFRVSIPSSSVEHLSSVGETTRLYTSLQVREDSLTLFGFLTEETRLAFEALIEINGVGPKVALSVLSRFTPDSLAMAVSAGDTDAFGGVVGVGKKTASRIVLELKGKLEGEWAVPFVDEGDVVEALAALGYSVAEARKAISSLPTDGVASVEDKVRMALKWLSSR